MSSTLTIDVAPEAGKDLRLAAPLFSTVPWMTHCDFRSHPSMSPGAIETSRTLWSQHQATSAFRAWQS